VTGDIGDLIRELAAGKNITQKQLAEASGIPRSTLNRIVGGKTRPSPDHLDRIADALGVTRDFLHRAYVISRGFRVEAEPTDDPDLQVLLGSWEGQDAATRAAIRAFIERLLRNHPNGRD
jgi:transcriptional regulator with XRE-family HTH domain